jgi:hypothetical protein
MTFSGNGLPGVNVGLSTRVSDKSPLYLGAELGFFMAMGTPSYDVLPLLGGLYYQFEPTAVVHPLLGVMAGPVITTGGGYSALRLGALVRPGVNFELGKSVVINAEPRFGVVGSTFVFVPEIGAIFAM